MIRDRVGNPYGGISDTTTLNFATATTTTTDTLPASTATTAKLPLGGTYQGTVDQAGDVDWIGITLPAGSTAYEFDLSGFDSGAGTLTDPHIQGIYDATGRMLSNTGGIDTNGTLDDTVSFQPTVTGIYYVACTGYGTATGTYALSVYADPFYGV